MAAVWCGFPLETRTVRLMFSVGDLFASTEGKIVVWDGIPVVMLNRKILHMFWNQPKNIHGQNYFLMVQFFPDLNGFICPKLHCYRSLIGE